MATMPTDMSASFQWMCASGALRFVELASPSVSALLFGNGYEAKSLTSSPGESSDSEITKLRYSGVWAGQKHCSQCLPRHSFLL